jgi:hypothetical protein
MKDESQPADPAEGFLANLIARRFFDLLRERSAAGGSGVRFLTFQPWEDIPKADRDALSDVFGLLMREAREQREEWTRAFVAAEVARMRDALGGEPGRLSAIEEGVRRASLSVAHEIEESEARGEWTPRPKPPLGALRTLDAEPTAGGLRLLVCSLRSRGCTWQTSTLHSEPGDGCTNPKGCAGVFELAPADEGRSDAKK